MNTARRAARAFRAWVYPEGFRSPDAAIYLAAGLGADVPAPFSRRWFLPGVFGGDLVWWRAGTYTAILVSAAHLGVSHGLGAALAFLGLSMVRTWTRIGVTPDAVAFALALGAADPSSPAWVRVVLALAAGACRETAPVFAALWCWSPFPLIGLVAVPWWLGGQGHTRPHRPAWGIGPWGWLPAVAALDVRTAATVAAAYGQCLIASDGARLYQWAAPALLAGLADRPWWMQVAIVVSIWVSRYEV